MDDGRRRARQPARTAGRRRRLSSARSASSAACRWRRRDDQNFIPGGTDGEQARLPVQRGRQGDEGPPRRQGSQPRRDDAHRLAGAARLHDHDRGLQPLLGHTAATRTASTSRSRRPSRPSSRHRQGVRRRRRPAARLGALRGPRLHAGHDGHDPQPGPQRHHGGGRHRRHRQPALRLRLLPPLRLHVRRRRARLQARTRGRARPVRGDPRGRQGAPRASQVDTDLDADDLKALVATLQGGRQGAHRQRLPRRSAGSSSGAPSRRSSAAGATTAPSPIAASTTSPTTGAPPSTCRRWSTATSATNPAPASPSRATRPPARTSSTASSSSTPRARTWSPACARRAPSASSQEVFPPAFEQLLEVRQTLERELRDMQDFEFTVEKGRLFMLQTRNGKRTGLAAIRIAVDMCEAGMITPQEALMRVEPGAAQPAAAADLLAREPARRRRGGPGPGQGPGRRPRRRHRSGRLQRRRRRRHGRAHGKKVLLVRIETSPDDIRGMTVSEGILTARGGMTSHAALVARQMGKVCVVGCEALDIDYRARTITVGDKVVNEGDWLSIDGFTGEVIVGQLETRPSEVLQVLLEGSLKPEDSRDLQVLRRHDEVGRRRAAAPRARQRRPARPERQRHQVRRPGHRPVPHRAHVLRRRAHHGGARDDPRRDTGRPREGARQAAADAARRLRRHLPRDGRAPGDDPPARPAAARVHAAHGRSSRSRSPRRWASRRCRSPPRSRTCTRPTRCSAIAAAAWASPIPRSRPCRRAPSSRPPASSRRTASTSTRRS